MTNAEQTATQTVARVTKKTQQNIKKLRTYFSETKDRRDIK